MSRPANPYDNASCESFIKTLKREEIYANLEHQRPNIEEFIERYYNRCPTTLGLGIPITRGVRAGRPFAWDRSDDEFFQAYGDLSIRWKELEKKEADRSRLPSPSLR